MSIGVSASEGGDLGVVHPGDEFAQFVIPNGDAGPEPRRAIQDGRGRFSSTKRSQAISAGYDRARVGARAKKHAVTHYLPYVAHRM